MLESGLDVRKVITHRPPASQFLDGFKRFAMVVHDRS
jgi:hypothetical protein